MNNIQMEAIKKFGEENRKTIDNIRSLIRNFEDIENNCEKTQNKDKIYNCKRLFFNSITIKLLSNKYSKSIITDIEIKENITRITGITDKKYLNLYFDSLIE